MRLSCATCGAHYEVDAAAIPEGGREVKCSACGYEWYEVPKAPLRLDPPPAPTPPPATPPTPVRPVPEDFRAILREEAAIETAARLREGTIPPAPTAPPPRRKGGFVTGVLLAILPLAVLAGLYLGAPRLAEEAPDLAEPLARYTAWVDQGRLALDRLIARIQTH
ncbi:zinc-ribbon domain-containing protein [Falsirhodobacter halotolerans]|uniref:zinc-ribbon domain-containing protein n=1 Tax=Falsirhodobacter halotolerans TaxID=1146892 RepID=UPI001FD35D3A|nr:zinc-ribbon domain-containing protein [Falsirhodobacter halotolerans]MCJ8140524.1 zinc-ribbon domain-containing protein [Falsirhodobacter halotolerans]